MFLRLISVVDNTVLNYFSVSFYLLMRENPHKKDYGQRENDYAGHDDNCIFFHNSNLVWMPFPATVCETVFPFGSTTVRV